MISSLRKRILVRCTLCLYISNYVCKVCPWLCCIWFIGQFGIFSPAFRLVCYMLRHIIKDGCCNCNIGLLRECLYGLLSFNVLIVSGLFAINSQNIIHDVISYNNTKNNKAVIHTCIYFFKPPIKVIPR